MFIKELLSTPTAQLGKAGRFLVFQIKLWSHCARLLKKNRSGQQAAALSYHTIFGLVPLAIVMLFVFQLFPAYQEEGERLKSLVYKNLHLTTIVYPNQAEEKVMLTDQLDRIVNDFFEGVDKGSITLVSIVFVIWAALALLATIERAFNNIWYVVRGRSFLHRVINYWAILTLGPILIGLGIYAARSYTALEQIEQTVLSHIGPAVLSYFVATVVFFLLYFVLPNTRVQAKAAIWGAIVAALVWTLAKWGFRQYVTGFIPYNKIYGVLGLIPLGVLWIYITWLIVLFGLQLTFTTQHLKTLDASEMAATGKREQYFIANDFTAISIVREIANAFERNQAPISSEVICSKLNIPAEFGEKIFDHLVRSNLIAKTTEPAAGFIPVRDPANIRLSDIAEAVDAASFAQSTPDEPSSLKQIAQSQKTALAQYSLKQILDTETDG
jgi:membrane protein